MNELHDDCAGPLVRELVETAGHVDMTCARLEGLAKEKMGYHRRAIIESGGLQTRDVTVAGAEYAAYLRAYWLLSGRLWGEVT